MLPNKLPSIINPVQLCRRAPPEGTEIMGVLKIGDLTNIPADLKKQHQVPIVLSLRFSVDSQNYCCIQGEAILEVKRTCQRCLALMTQAVRLEFKVSPVESDAQAIQLPDEYEPLKTINNEVIMKEWIAEELNLGLPFVPLHDTQCVSYENYTHSASEFSDSEVSEETSEKVLKKSPFEGLKKLKDKLKNKDNK